LEKRDFAPGMHGQRRGKPSEYAKRLREKQKLKRFYGVLERQFRRYFELASRSKENTGEVLLGLMERRLDNVVYRLGWAPSRAGARQMVSHGHVTLNGKFVNIPSLLLKAGDVITLKNRPRTLQLVKLAGEGGSQAQPPDYLEQAKSEPPEAKMIRLPNRGDVDPHIADIQEQLIIEVSAR
jgi:small subunit ribosomal protein S4